MATLFSDNFDRSNRNLNGDNSWTDNAGTPTIVSNRVYASVGGANGAHNTTSLGTADYQISMDYDCSTGRSSTTGFLQLFLRGNTSGTYINDSYCFYYQEDTNDYMNIYKFVGGSATQIMTNVSFTQLSGTHTFKASVSGSTLKWYLDGTEKGSVTDTAITKIGYAGFRIGPNTYGDNFLVESLSAASANLAKVNGIALASIAKYQGIAKASVAKINGLTIK